MAFERERKLNNIAMIAGIIAAVAGFAAYFMVNEVLGVVLMIAGVAIIVITATISSAFYKISMMEYLEDRRKNKK